MQRIVWPWLSKGWAVVVQKITTKINNINDLDIRIVAKYNTSKLKPRMVATAFDTYFSTDGHLVPRQLFIDDILPVLQDLVKRLPTIFKNIPGDVLGPGVNYNYVFTREQCAAAVAGAFFGVFGKISLTAGPLGVKDMQPLSFHLIFQRGDQFALSCLMCYFNYIYESLGTPHFAAGRIIVRRNAAEAIAWNACEAPLAPVTFESGPVDSAAAQILTVFAGNPLGGDMFSGTPTQEIIFMLTRPDAFIAVLLTCKLDLDTITVFGTEKISGYTGYGCGVTFTGPIFDETPVYDDGKITVRQSALVFMDSSKKMSSKAQLEHDFLRDLNKAYTGYGAIKGRSTTVAGGNWTYGYNSSNMQVKFIQQLLAASARGHALEYHAISPEFRDIVEVFVSRLDNRRVCDVFNEYCNMLLRVKFTSSTDIFEEMEFDN